MLNRKNRTGKSAAANHVAFVQSTTFVEHLENRSLFTATPAVTGFVLYNSATDKPIATITSGETLNVAKLPSTLTVVATTTNAESIRFGYDGNAIFKQDSTELYALAGKKGTDLYQMGFSLGNHVITAIAYSQDVMQGVASPTVTFNLTLVHDTNDSRTMWAPASTTTSPPVSPPVSPPAVSPPPVSPPVSPPPPPPAVTSPPPPPPTVTSPPPPPATATAAAKLETTDTTIFAGQSFFASGVNTTLSSGDVTTADYEWNFGDTGSKYNTLTGFNAAHLYANPGTYTVTLTVTDDAGKVMKSTQAVTVQADTRKTIYVSPTGNDKNNGLSASSPIATLEQAEKLETSNSRILFQRGGTWNVTDWLYIKGQNIDVGAYGTGADPVLKRATTAVTMLVGVDKTSTDVTIHDIAFDTNQPTVTDKSGAATGIFPQGTRTAIYDCQFVNVVDAINANTGPTGLLIQDNVATTDHSVRGYFVWLQGSDDVILGNTVPNSTREHIIRIGGADRVLIADNTFANEDNSAKDPLDISKAVFNDQVGNDIYITHNTITDGVTGVGPLGGADGVSTPNLRISNVVIDGNTFNNANLAVTGGSDHVTIRNNLINRNYAEAILVNPTDTYTVNGKQIYAGRTITSLTIANNTYSSTGTSGNFLLVKTMGTAGQITLDNNVVVAPNYIPGANGTAAVYIAADAATAKAQFKEISGNVWSTEKPNSYAEGGYFYVWPTWSDKSGYLTPAEWASWGASLGTNTDRFPTGTLSINTTTGIVTGLPTGVTKIVKGVFDDLNDKLRLFSTTQITAGAIQL